MLPSMSIMRTRSMGAQMRRTRFLCGIYIIAPDVTTSAVSGTRPERGKIAARAGAFGVTSVRRVDPDSDVLDPDGHAPDPDRMRSIRTAIRSIRTGWRSIRTAHLVGLCVKS